MFGHLHFLLKWAIAYNDAREKRRASIAVDEERAWEFFPRIDGQRS